MNLRRISSLIALFTIAMLMGLGQTQLQTSTPTLRVDQPETYLELGEQLAALARNQQQIGHASQVLAMGVLLAQRANNPQLAASCCIALSTLEQGPEQRRDLWDLALLLDPGRFQGWVEHRPSASISRDAAQAAECLRLIRNAEFEDAGVLFNQERTRSTLRETAAALGYEPEKSIERIKSLLAMTHSDGCKGRVFVTRVRDGESFKTLCTDHTYPIGSAPDVPTLQMLLSMELACMNGASQLRDWGGAESMSLDQPMRFPETQMLITRYQIDPDRPYWDGSRWSATP